MGTISSGIGLISGLNISSIVTQLMAIEAKPRDLLQTQVTQMDSVKAAWMDLSARLLGLKSFATTFDDASTFQTVNATSSNPSVLAATATAGAVPGVYQFTPVQMVANHQVISAGLHDPDATAVGAGTLTIDIGQSQLARATPLDFLNGQHGVPRGSIKITDRSGASATVDLSTAASVQDVLDAINNTAGIAVSASVSGDSIVLKDNTGSTSANLSVAEVNGRGTAAGLGLLKSIASDTLTGNDVVSVAAATALGTLNDGNGVRVTPGDDLKITAEDGTSFLVDVLAANTLGDVIQAINAAADNGGKVVAAIADTGDGLKLTDLSGGLAGPLTVESFNGSLAGRDLGLLGSDDDADHVINGQRLAGGLNSVLLRNLNGGAGVAAGAIALQDRGTGSAVVDLSSAQTVQDVIDLINGAAGVSVHAALNSVGNGIQITDTTGQSLRNFSIAESGGGTTAADLHLVHDAADAAVNSGDLGLRYVSENTALADWNVAAGKFTITDSSGASAVVDLTQGDEKTLGKVIDEINSRGIGVVASINDAGNGLLLTDTAGGAGTMSVAESGSTTAADLGILGTDANGDHQIDGSRRITIAVGAGDTLADVTAKLSATTTRLSAAVINDGSSVDPYRLVLTSKSGGEAGRLVIDPGTTGLSFDTMTRPQDALVFLGDPANPNSVAIRSSSNSISSVINNVTLNVVGTSAAPVTLTVASSVDGFVSQMKSFVASFNDVVGQIDTVTKYDAATQTKGVLQGDGTAIQVRSALFSMITDPVSGASGPLSRLFQIGLTVSNNGTQISFDESKFRQAYAASPSAVSDLFTAAATGVGDRFDTALSHMTDSSTGTVSVQLNSLNSRQSMLNDQIARMNDLLATRQTRLTAQFQAMETALAQLQSQSSALLGLSSTASSLFSGDGLFGSSSASGSSTSTG